jgi:glycosyltransferase involved in cell wall biosynthesis
LAYSFGLSVLATDVGSLRGDIVKGRTGMSYRPMDANDLADTINAYFGSQMFNNLQFTAKCIMDYGNRKYSWEEVANITCGVYDELIDDCRGERGIN